jgi:GDP-L-fucose synthase
MKKQQMMMSKDDYDPKKCEEFIDKVFKEYLSSTNILVTGGSGFLGKRLQIEKPDWNYISSKDCDLTDKTKVKELLNDLKPAGIIHLAARVGGIKDNIENQADFFYLNTMINTNVIHEAHKANIDRVLSSLSTCAFPENIEDFPFDEDVFFCGAPAITNFSYGMTKRMLHVSSISYRKQYGRNYSTFCPSNIYGPQDHFNEESSHFVAALVHKTATTADSEAVKLWGTGTPMRQQLYIDDLCKIIPLLLERHNTDVPLIVSPNENLTIKEMSESLIKQIDKCVKIEFDNNMDGQFRKDGNNSKLLELIGDFKFTAFDDGIMQTYNWYLENK